MFCTKCGREIEYGSRFCASCGEKVYDYSEENNGFDTYNHGSPGSLPKNRKRLFILVPVIVVCAIVLAFLGIKAFKFIKKKTTKSVCIVNSDEGYSLYNKIQKDNGIVFDSNELLSDEKTTAVFSPDGSFFYYLASYSDDYGEGTLYRVEVNKIKKKSTTNAGEIISKNVRPGMQAVNNGLLYYKNDDLYYYDGKDSKQIYNTLYSVENDRTVIVGEDTDDYLENVYSVDLNNPDTAKLIVKDVDSVYLVEGTKSLVYADEDDNIISVGFDGRKTILVEGEKGGIVNLYEDTLVYYVINDEPLIPFDYINDNLKKNDEDIIKNHGSYTEEDFEKASGRNLIRESLQEELDVCSIYYYREGKSSLISSSTIDIKGNIYAEWDVNAGKSDIEEIYDYMDSDYGNGLFNYVFYTFDNNKSKVELPDIKILRENEIDDVFIYDNKLFLMDIEGGIYVGNIQSGRVSDIKLLVDDVHEMILKNGKLAYYKSAQNNDGYDWFLYYKGSFRQIASNVGEIMDLFEDGNMVFRSDNDYECDIEYVDSKGNVMLREEAVEDYARIDKKTLLFKQDGDLYSFDGENSVLIDDNVNCFWNSKNMNYDTFYDGYQFFNGDIEYIDLDLSGGYDSIDDEDIEYEKTYLDKLRIAADLTSAGEIVSACNTAMTNEYANDEIFDAGSSFLMIIEDEDIRVEGASCPEFLSEIKRTLPNGVSKKYRKDGSTGFYVEFYDDHFSAFVYGGENDGVMLNPRAEGIYGG
ncbi:MAG: zinc ribbon domain-containing protein [Eubacterium sp.]|nr:zinc ribbon domain-containing protein [Eubacterium sp.]